MPVPPSLNSPYGVVYLITNTVNGKVYVGQTVNLKRRISAHMVPSCQHSIGPAVKKYGRDNFVVDQIGCAHNQPDLDNLESVWIILLKSTNRSFGYNRRFGGTGSRPSAESRKRMSEAQKANPQRFWLGKKRPDMVGNKYTLGRKYPRDPNKSYAPIIVRAKQGSEEHRRKLSIGVLARLTDEVREKLSAAGHKMWARQKEKGMPLRHSEDAKARRSEREKERYKDPALRERLRQQAIAQWADRRKSRA